MKQKILIVILSAILFIVSGFIRQYGFIYDFYITPILYAFLVIGMFFFTKRDIWLVILYTCLGLALINVIAYLVDGKPSVIMYRNVSSYFLGILLGGSVLQFKKPLLRIAAIAFYGLIVLIYSNNYNSYVENFANSGSFTGKENLALPEHLYAVDINKDTINFNNNSTYVLDFWFRGCGACFRAFPKFEAFYNKYKTDSNTKIYSINIPVGGDSSNSAFQIMSPFNYTFPILVGINSIDSLLGIASFPEVIIIQNNKIIFKGSIELAGDFYATLH